MPVTERTRLFRKILGVVWVMSISIITLVLNDFASRLMDVGFHVTRLQGKEVVITAVLLVGSSLLCWLSYRGNRRNLAPPTWGLVTMTALVWAALLLNHFA